MPFDQMERSSSGRRARKRAKMARGVELRTTHEFESRIGFSFVQAQTQELFVVAQLDVVLRTVLLDEIVLEDRRFFFRTGQYGLDIDEFAAKPRNEGPFVTATRLKVTADPRTEALGPCPRKARPPAHRERGSNRVGSEGYQGGRLAALRVSGARDPRPVLARSQGLLDGSLDGSQSLPRRMLLE